MFSYSQGRQTKYRRETYYYQVSYCCSGYYNYGSNCRGESCNMHEYINHIYTYVFNLCTSVLYTIIKITVIIMLFIYGHVAM